MEGSFSTDDIRWIKPDFEREDLEWTDGVLIIRREINPDGRSRAFVNDTPVSLKQLSTIGGKIIDIHSQHSNQMLADSNYKLQIVDLLSDNEQIREDYKQAFIIYAGLRSKLKKVRAEILENESKQLYYQMQLEKIRKLAPKHGEQISLEREQELLANAEIASLKLQEASSCLSQRDVSVLSLLDQARTALHYVGEDLIASTPEAGKELLQRLETNYLEIKDLAELVSGYSSEITANPARLESIQERLDLYYETISSFNVATGDDLITLSENLEQKIRTASNSEVLQKIEKDTNAAAISLRNLASDLTVSRKKGAFSFEYMLTESAKSLGMSNLRFNVEISSTKLSLDGGDAVEFICSFNKNSAMLPIQKVASGGELSRLMLAIKALLSSKLHIPTLVFDEVDTGVSGDIADKMGRMMRDISNSDIQVISITHLPQVASLGSWHYLVSKHDDNQTTITHIKKLDSDERVEEIARMLSGKYIDSAARSNAISMLNNSQ